MSGQGGLDDSACETYTTNSGTDIAVAASHGGRRSGGLSGEREDDDDDDEEDFLEVGLAVGGGGGRGGEAAFEYDIYPFGKDSALAEALDQNMRREDHARSALLLYKNTR